MNNSNIFNPFLHKFDGIQVGDAFKHKQTNAIVTYIAVYPYLDVKPALLFMDEQKNPIAITKLDLESHYEKVANV